MLMMAVRLLHDAAVLSSTAAFAALTLPAAQPINSSGCETGAAAIGNAYIRANYLYAMFFGDLESYVAENRSHFAPDGDAIRCARVLSQGLMAGAVQSYDPSWQRTQDNLNARLGAMGLSPGPATASPSAQLYTAAQQLSRLARVLPAAAQGNFDPLHTPTTEMEQMQLFAAQMMQFLLQDPAMRDTLQQMEPLIREAAQAEYSMLMSVAAQVGR